jgi:hypothetical protein
MVEHSPSDPAESGLDWLACCRSHGREDKIVTKEPENSYDETDVQPRFQD